MCLFFCFVFFNPPTVQIKPQSFESRLNFFFLPGAKAPRASTVYYFYSLVSIQIFGGR